jgi:hypothetical protein
LSLCNWDAGEHLITTMKFVIDRNESRDPLMDLEEANPVSRGHSPADKARVLRGSSWASGTATASTSR